MRGRAWLSGLVVTLGLMVGLLAGPASTLAAVSVPPGFTDQLVTVVPRPVALAWTPNGRMLIATKQGFVRVYQNGVLLPNPAIDLRAQMCRSTEWGLNGLALDPDFASNHYVYLYYTFNKFNSCETNSPSSPVNRVSRFVLGNNNVIDPLSEYVVVDGIQDPDGFHAGGNLEFGKDGYLYINTGDGGCDFRGDSGCYPLNDAAQDLGGMTGKVLRVTSTGDIPPDNPFLGPTSVRCSGVGYTSIVQQCQENFAYGLRNPFRAAHDPNSPTTRFFIDDVGQDTWEEVNEGQSGANYGWNAREGNCVTGSSTDCGPPPLGMTNPVYSYNHSNPDTCVAATTAAFVPNGIWPAQYDGKFILGDFVCGKLWTLAPDGAGGYTPTDFASGISNPVAGSFGPYNSTQAFYYLSWLTFPDDEIHRIVYTGQTNASPTAVISADPTSGSQPLTVEFNGSGSSDPENDPLTYDWNFGDGSPHSTAVNPQHNYMTPGEHLARLTVDDGHGNTGTDTVTITVGNEPPQVTIDAPYPGQLFSVDQQLTLTGTAEDIEDGTLPNSSLVWRVEKHHATHTHPFLDETSGNDIPITGPPPEDLLAATNSYLEILLTATDSGGLSTTVTRNLNPRTVSATFHTSPSGLSVNVAGDPLQAPVSPTSWHNWGMPISAPDQVDSQGQGWHFSSWSDGGAQTHVATMPALPTTWTATFTPNQAPTATATADVTSGQAPLVVNFDGSSSSDPDPQDSLTYDWDFGDGSPHSSAASPTHTYTTPGSYTATLTVSDGLGGTDTAPTIPIEAANDPPQVSIDAPVAGKLWKVGEQMTLTGTANDPQQGSLPLTWKVLKHVGATTTTFLGDTTGNNVPITGPAPDDLASTTNTSLEIELKATDAQGVSDTATRTINPKTVNLSFDTSPTGLTLQLAGQPSTAPRTITSWQDWAIPVGAPSQSSGGSYYHFASWSDGGAASHTITTPGTATSYTATFQINRAPVASLSASPTSGDAPLNVGFNGIGSSDPDNDTLSYDWDFGDGSPHSSAVSPSHTYSQGSHTAILTVSDGHGGQDTESTLIQVANGAPQATISSPASGFTWSVGQQITLTGSATDFEDGSLANSSLSWKVLKHVGAATTTFLPDTTGNNVQITGPAPDDLASTNNTTLEVQLTATDSQGRSTTVNRTIQPKKVNVTFQTSPSGLKVQAAGTELTGPATITSWQGWSFQVSAQNQYDSSVKYFLFSSWSDGGAATHTITTPATAGTLVANFTAYAYPRPGGASPLRVPLVPQFRPCQSPDSEHLGPLNYPSCTNPQLSSSQLSLSNLGKASNFVRYDVIPGTPPPTQDDADMRIRVGLTDVFRNFAPFPDYAGKVILDTTIRMTDALSGPFQQTAATVEDVELSFPIDCFATSGGTGGAIGSNCNLDVTTDSLLPNFAKERSRTVMSLVRIRLLDAGPDSSVTPFSGSCPPTCGTGDETVYLVPGVFAP